MPEFSIAYRYGTCFVTLFRVLRKPHFVQNKLAIYFKDGDPFLWNLRILQTPLVTFHIGTLSFDPLFRHANLNPKQKLFKEY